MRCFCLTIFTHFTYGYITYCCYVASAPASFLDISFNNYLQAVDYKHFKNGFYFILAGSQRCSKKCTIILANLSYPQKL